MITDIITMIWKEWKEVFLRRGSTRSGLMNLVIILGLLGIIMPLQTGKAWLENPLLTLVWSWVPVFLAISIVTDGFAGERERHTLETLLASRLSDQAILLGKLSAAVLYSWGIAIASMLIGVVTINVLNPGSGFLFYTGYIFPLGAGLSLLASILISAIGVLVSLNAPTARQAYQRLSIVLIILWLLPTLSLQFLPKAFGVNIASSLSNINFGPVLLYAVLFLIAADIVMVGVALSRFRRARLILE